jgi:hypothetical protein
LDTAGRLKVLMTQQKNAIISYSVLASAVFFIGILMFFIVLLFSQAIEQSFGKSVLDAIKPIAGVAATFISSLGLFPIKEVTTYRSRYDVYKQLTIELAKASKTEKKEIESIVSDAIKKLAVG